MMWRSNHANNLTSGGAPVTATPRPLFHRIRSGIGVSLISIIVGFLLVEAGYRVVLLRDPRMMLPWRMADPMKVAPVEAYNRSLWTYDFEEGYQYTRENVYATRVEQGVVTDCRMLNPINAIGGAGLIEGDYASADVKVAVFGDSFTWWSDAENLTWTNYFQRDLQRLTRRSVHVLNFARDGIAVMRMFDLAATRLPNYRPDFVIFAVTTSSIGPGRSWRFEAVVDGEQRVFTVPTPEKTTDPSIAFDTYVLHPRATLQWCQSVKGRGDDVAREIVDKYVRFRVTRYSPFDTSRSFLWNKIVHRDPFTSSKAVDRITRTALPGPFSNDAAFVHAVGVVEKAKIPYMLFHVPFYPEVASGNEFLPGAELARSELEKATGHSVVGLLENLGEPVREPERMNQSGEELHPSTWGMKMIATGALKAAIRERLVKSDL
jgi:hypothetical protein